MMAPRALTPTLDIVLILYQLTGFMGINGDLMRLRRYRLLE